MHHARTPQVVFVALALAFGGSRSAHAQPATDGHRALQEATSSGAASTPHAEVPLVWHRWPLFDPFVDTRRRGVLLGYALWREQGTGLRNRGATGSYARSITTVRGHAAVTLRREIELSVLTGPTVALGLARHELVGSLDFAGVQLGAGVGVLPAAVDYSRGDFSIAVLSPRAVAVLSVPLGVARLSFVASSGYYWRVWGREDCLVQHLAIELSLLRAKELRRGRHPLIVR